MPHARHAAGRHRESAEGLRVLLSLAGRARVGRVIVLIPAHNEAASIRETISSLRRQTRPPDEIIVISDNSSDATDDRSMLHGAKVVVTAGNSAHKAGALNQALGQVLPKLGRGDLALVMDADSQLAPDWIRCAVDAMDRDPELGGVSGTYTGEDGPGLLRQLQRNEFVRASRLVRRRYDLWVLSGTGTMFRVSALREVARERGRSLPGVPGEYYDSSSITEDYEITLALKTLGYRCLCPPGCTAITELMPTWRHLFRQRLRWPGSTSGRTAASTTRTGDWRTTRPRWPCSGAKRAPSAGPCPRPGQAGDRPERVASGQAIQAGRDLRNGKQHRWRAWAAAYCRLPPLRGDLHLRGPADRAEGKALDETVRQTPSPGTPPTLLAEISIWNWAPLP
jgi:hypothetical protein